MMGVASLDIAILFISLAWFLRLATGARKVPRGLRLPPGPPRKFIFGNAQDMPTQQEWVTFSRWAKEYGDIVYLNVLGQDMVVINSADVAYDLFEKSSSIYSDRGEFPMINDLMGFDWNIGFMHYGEWWRRHRKLFHQKFHPGAVIDYHSIQARQTMELLRRYRDTPQDFVEHIRHNAGAIIMEIIYGIKVKPKNDHYIDIAEKALWGMTVAGNPGTYLVDVLPILKYVPAWMPGAGFRRQARKWRECTTEMSVVPFMTVKQSLDNGTAVPSFTAHFLEKLSMKSSEPSDEEDVIRGVGSTAYAAGSDTTVSALHTFMLAMVVNPEAQKKAQAELDNVVGPYRLPEFGDRDSLPYVNAVIKEVLRWQPVAPLGVAHRVTQDDVYRDYFIPKGSLILGNIWNMCHDEATYGPETEKFKPERFLVPGVKDPNAAFGFGRRICPGRYLADTSIFIVVASILKVFDITLSRDGNGKEIPVKAAFTSGFMSHPEDFKCTIRPRSELALKLIMDPTDEDL